MGAALDGADAWRLAELVVGAALDGADAWRLAELVVGAALDGADAWRRGKTTCLSFSLPFCYPFTTLSLPFYSPPIHYIFFTPDVTISAYYSFM